MGVGRMRERVKLIEVEHGQPDGMGGYIPIKVEKSRCWARVMSMDERRAESLRNTGVTSPVEFHLRGAGDLHREMLIEWRGDQYRIHSITYDEKRRYKKVIAWHSQVSG